VAIFEQVIGELKAKEKALQELYQLTDRKAKNLAGYNEYILKSMTSGMIICDEGGKIIRMNGPARAILDVSEEQVLGKLYTVVFERLNPIRSAIEAAFSERSAQSVPEIRLPQTDGENVHLALIKRLEEEVALKDKMATLGEMSAGLAHELRNSMGAILGFVKLLKREKDQPVSQNRTVDAIFSEAMSMESMLQRFLAFAKPYQLKIDKVDLVKVIEECHASVQGLMKDRKITFELGTDPHLIPILGDPLLLKQSFQNLMQNSIDAMPDGGRLSVSLRRDRLPFDKEVVSTEISDTGCGIPKEIQDKIFNPFFTSKEKGTGLGLSLVKKFMGLHNGKIELESRPGEGTTFAIHLPLKPEPHLTKTRMQESKILETSV
jgi:signal transduction histidine kinase